MVSSARFFLSFRHKDVWLANLCMHVNPVVFGDMMLIHVNIVYYTFNKLKTLPYSTPAISACFIKYGKNSPDWHGSVYVTQFPVRFPIPATTDNFGDGYKKLTKEHK